MTNRELAQQALDNVNELCSRGKGNTRLLASTKLALEEFVEECGRLRGIIKTMEQDYGQS